MVQFHAAFVTSKSSVWIQARVSTDLCTGLIKNVSARYCHSGTPVHGYFLYASSTPVYGCFLYASKAIDHVDHSQEFSSEKPTSYCSENPSQMVL